MCSCRLATSHEVITHLNNPGHPKHRFCLIEFRLETFIGQQNKKLEYMRRKRLYVSINNMETFCYILLFDVEIVVML